LGSFDEAADGGRVGAVTAPRTRNPRLVGHRYQFFVRSPTGNSPIG
jgi:hypothetical protein